MMRTGTIRVPVAERFAAKNIPEPNSGCWLWIGSVEPKMGYGSFMLKSPRAILAHRASYMMHKGEIPAGIKVLHTCDQPSCVNPDHLWLGTDKDNTDDAIRKGRRPQSVPKIIAVDDAHVRSAFQALTERLARKYRTTESRIRAALSTP